MKNQKGLSLIEILAALTILMIISSIIYGVFFNVDKNYKQISQKSNLEQEANIIINTIKNYHQRQNTYKLSYNPLNGDAFIGTTAANIPLERSDLQIFLKAGYPLPEDFAGEITIDGSIPLAIYLKITTKQGQSYEIDTIIKRY